jgi:hypothetical protein
MKKTSRQVANEWEIATHGRRLRRGEWYRVTAINEWDQSVISHTRYSTLRSAEAAQQEWERTGITAILSIRAPDQS